MAEILEWTQEQNYQKIVFEVYADHFQFFIQDPASPNVPAPDHISTIMVTANAGVVKLTTWSYDVIPVALELWETKAEFAENGFEQWNHVEEVSLQINSGMIAIRELFDDGEYDVPLMVKPNWYRIRVYYGNLHLKEYADPYGSERYRIVIWPDSPIEPTMLKESELVWQNFGELLTKSRHRLGYSNQT